MTTQLIPPLSPKDAAIALGCHVDFVLAEINSGSLRAARINARVIRVTAEDLIAYRAARTITPAVKSAQVGAT